MKSLQTIKTVALLVSIASLSACVTQQEVKPASAPVAQQPMLPDWITNPVLENGIADTQCVVANPGTSMSTLKSAATASARAELAKQIGVKVKAMDKTYNRLTNSTAGPSSGETFESVSKQVAEEYLSGSRAIQTGYVALPPDNKQNFCVMVAMSPEQTKALFQDLISKTGSNVSPTNEAVLYERFLQEKAIKEMEAELEKAGG